MLNDCAEIFNRYYNVQFIFNVNLVKLISLDSDGGLQRFSEDSWNG